MPDAERTLAASRQQLVQAGLLLADDVVTRYGEPGGGWQAEAERIRPANPPARPPPVPGAADVLESKAGGF